jgi:hypothetical protein
MNRGHFFKSLLTLAVAPKIISEIDFNKKSNKLGCKNHKSLFKKLNYLDTNYYKQMVAKYGNESYLDAINICMNYDNKI